jgi:hypothetical protein
MTRANIVGVVVGVILFLGGAVLIKTGFEKPGPDPAGKLSGDDWQEVAAWRSIVCIGAGFVVCGAGFFVFVWHCPARLRGAKPN